MSHPDPARPAYPDPTYSGEGGELTARFRPAGTEADLRTPGGGAASYLATGATTDGRFGLYRWDMGPGPGGAQPHFHRTMSESFFVLDGTVSIFDGRSWADARPGDFAHVPDGGVHGFRNESGAPASMLILFAPGAPREKYFIELAEIAESGRELTDEEWVELWARHDQYPA